MVTALFVVTFGISEETEAGLVEIYINDSEELIESEMARIIKKKYKDRYHRKAKTKP